MLFRLRMLPRVVFAREATLTLDFKPVPALLLVAAVTFAMTLTLGSTLALVLPLETRAESARSIRTVDSIVLVVVANPASLLSAAETLP